ncbi:MAG TPA: aspartyl/asparaginyl beta-hydroxylase domain-containing protein [Rhizomicrobium sp.]|nr:aspartyl/asparaginyl beta-hydroxylase domain-containing protein [Rhizomicrobium sp.]
MDYRDFVSGIRQAYQHTGGIKTLCLGSFDKDWFQQIQAECAWIIKNAGSSDVTMAGHVTNWTRPTGQVRQFSLFNDTGNSADTKGDYGYLGDARRKRLVYPNLPALSRFASMFQPALRNLRLNGMGLKSALSAHEEESISISRFGPRYIVRFHAPIFTNPNAFVYLDDERFHFEEGKLYLFHHGCVHAASNTGQDLRYHLVFDCFLDRALFERIFPGTPSPDVGYEKDCQPVHGESFHFENFVKEDNSVITGDIAYGRRAPGLMTYYRRRWPSVFGAA